ncbi:MAG: hypothetical protein QNK37_33710 [Acidobacteriota bacterium]|nr:hypothetical protein [Acidobacteriota bacterium]
MRTAHRVAFLVMAAAAPALLIGSLLVRQLPAEVDRFAPVRPEDHAVSGQWWLNDDTLWGELTIETRLYGTSKRMILELAPKVAFEEPDILVMWQEGESTEVAGENAYLLGTLSAKQARRFQLPPTAYERNGRLFLYSLAWDKHIASCALPSKEAYEGEFRPSEEF